MSRLLKKHIHNRLRELENYLLKQYKEQARQEKRDWSKYEKEFKQRFGKAMNNLNPLIEQATRTLKFYRARGDKPTLRVDQKLRLLLLSQLAGKSNRMMAYMTRLFSLLTGIDRSYKTIERLYSDPEVEAVLFNLWVSILKKKEVREADTCGDATGYGLFISKHYSSYAKKLKDNFVWDTMNHLEEYFKRNNSESGFGADKKMFGWKVRQKREDRIDTALFYRDI